VSTLVILEALEHLVEAKESGEIKFPPFTWVEARKEGGNGFKQKNMGIFNSLQDAHAELNHFSIDQSISSASCVFGRIS
jgi:hypothetical protein